MIDQVDCRRCLVRLVQIDRQILQVSSRIRIDRNGEPVGGGIAFVVQTTGGGDQARFRIQGESSSAIAILGQSQIRVTRSIAHAHKDMGHFRSTG